MVVTLILNVSSSVQTDVFYEFWQWSIDTYILDRAKDRFLEKMWSKDSISKYSWPDFGAILPDLIYGLWWSGFHYSNGENSYCFPYKRRKVFNPVKVIKPHLRNVIRVNDDLYSTWDAGRKISSAGCTPHHAFGFISLLASKISAGYFTSHNAAAFLSLRLFY